jgi:hypothetical protein
MDRKDTGRVNRMAEREPLDREHTRGASGSVVGGLSRDFQARPGCLPSGRDAQNEQEGIGGEERKEEASHPLGHLDLEAKFPEPMVRLGVPQALFNLSWWREQATILPGLQRAAVSAATRRCHGSQKAGS